MQQFTVPQFIDVEDKIIGPVTTRQFIIILAGAVLIGISYKIFDFSLFVVVGVVILIIFGAIAFVRINGRPFHYFLLNFLQTLKRPGLRVWGQGGREARGEPAAEASGFIDAGGKTPVKEQPTVSRLSELSLIVDTQGAYGGEDKNKEAEMGVIKR